MTVELVRSEQQGHQRTVEIARPGDADLGPLAQLPGRWVSDGLGWNMIALPFARVPGSFLNYRLLLNQFDEELNFTLVDKAVPNRGVTDDSSAQTDQFVVTLDYEQVVHQVAVEDNPVSQVTGAPGAAIHHEPGLFLNMTNEIGPDNFDVARLGTVPHGDSVLALGRSSVVDGVADIPAVNGLPVGVNPDLTNPYLAPYKHFVDNPFVGTVGPGFPGFSPVAPHLLLELANTGLAVTRTTVLDLDTTLSTGGITNIPFVVKQANAVSMKSTFWIQELAETDAAGAPLLRLQYLQIVMLDFFPRRDGLPGLIGWPHVSINTLSKVSDTPQMVGYDPSA